MSTLQTRLTGPAIITAMPKAELHVHLDGCLRPQTVIELAAEQGMELPVAPGDIDDLLVAPVDCVDLMDVLSYFAVPLQVLQTPDALERVTYELGEDLADENVRYAEIRFGPSLHTENGMRLSETIEAVLRGWRAARQTFGLRGGIILSALRHLPPEESLAVARAGLPYLGHGVVGFDLAGDEAQYPVLIHREPLLWAREAGYGMTVHAGEAAGAESVRDAVEVIGVSRIGHGVRAGEDPDLLDVLRKRWVTLDMCPTSNVQTRAVPSLRLHPAARFYRSGVRVTLNSDNRTVSSTTVTNELLLGHEAMDLDVSELATMTLMALDAGFGPGAERTQLMSEFYAQFDQLGVTPGSFDSDL